MRFGSGQFAYIEHNGGVHEIFLPPCLSGSETDYKFNKSQSSYTARIPTVSTLSTHNNELFRELISLTSSRIGILTIERTVQARNVGESYDPSREAKQKAICEMHTDQFLAAYKLMAQSERLSINCIIKAHKQLNLGPRVATRSYYVRCGNDPMRPTCFMPPPPTFIRQYLNDLVRFVNYEPVNWWLKINIAFAQLVHIHPFSDGNGRIARAMCLAISKKENRSMYLSALLPVFHILTGREQLLPALASLRRGNKTNYMIYSHHAFTWCVNELKFIEKTMTTANTSQAMRDIRDKYVYLIGEHREGMQQTTQTTQT